MKIKLVQKGTTQRKPQNFCPWYMEDNSDKKK